MPVTSPASISSGTLAQVQHLHRETAGPFTVDEAARLLQISRTRARRLLAYLVERGWLTRIRRGLYGTVPLEASSAASWQQDPWAVAAATFAPCYIGGWSACEHWSLTDQVFREIVVVTGRYVRDHHPTIQGVPYRLKHRQHNLLFGTRGVWRDRVRVEVSDPSRTIVDVLDDPALGGGIRHVAEVLAAYLAEGLRDDPRLIDYGMRLGNRSVFKRLGYLIEAGGLPAPELAVLCREHLSSGITLLDPSAPARGPISSRWGLRLNVRVGEREDQAK
jgi:predicted transcriptional regulator of viral defense system